MAERLDRSFRIDLESRSRTLTVAAEKLTGDLQEMLRISMTLASVFLLGTSTVVAGVNTWTTNGPPGGASAVAIDPGDTSLLYAPPWRSANRGRTWLSVDLSSEHFSSFAKSVVAAGPPGTVYATAGLPAPNTEVELLLKSQDAGLIWTQIAEFPTFCSVAQLLIDPNDADIIYVVGTSCLPVGPNRPPTGFLIKSLDGGQTWIDGSWGQGLTGLELGPPSALAIDSTNRETLYVSTPTGLFKTVDGGSNWSLLAPSTEFTEQPYALVVDPSNPTTLYASIHLSGVFKSTDGGRTFQPVNNGLPEVLLVSSLVIDPKHSSRLYVAVGGIGPPPNGTFDQRAGVFTTGDGGESWRAINEGLPDLLDPLLGGRLGAFQLVIDAKGEFLLAATPAGVFDYEFLPDLTPVRLSRPRPEAREVQPRR